MTDIISLEAFNHIVKLAALEIDANQAAYLHHELNSQLKAIRELEAIPLDHDTPNDSEVLPLTSHGVPYTPQISQDLRPDKLQPYETPSTIVSQSPQEEDGYIVVPDIPHTTLE